MWFPLSPTACARDLWDDLFPTRPHARPPGTEYMLYLIAYDISDPKRLQRIADICEDFGVRVQYSLFECWLEPEQFADLWARLQMAFQPESDRLVAYPLDAAAIRRRQSAGVTMVLTQRIQCYLV